MLRKLIIVLVLAVSACDVPSPAAKITPEKIPLSANPCEGRAKGKCTFVNAPVALQPNPIRLIARPLPFFRTARPLAFIDARPRKWQAPEATLTDGASIPEVFVPVVGNPRSHTFINAATLHDAYCGVGNENLPEYHSDTWQNVHRMFYDALRVGGTPAKKAKIMYAAVYLAGPRWYTPGSTAKSGAYPDAVTIISPYVLGPTNTPLTELLSDEALVNALRGIIAFINKTNPSLPELNTRLLLRERELLKSIPRESHGDGGENDTSAGGGGVGGYSDVYGVAY